jgi:hypothetical protein
MRLFIAVAALCLVGGAADARPRRHVALEPGQPAACAGIPWCGCWLRLRKGLADLRLNRAREWVRLGAPAHACRPGLIAVWPHHVGEITECLGGGLIRMISGNDSNAVRDRVRPLGGARLRAL